MAKDFIKYGGVEFKLKADEKAINTFVAALPAEKRSSIFVVSSELLAAGLIEIPPNAEHSTVDTDFMHWQNIPEQEIHAANLADRCPACRAVLRFTPDASSGDLIECAACGADLTVLRNGEGIDVRLSSEIEQ